jgi:DNA-binding GntR family transcriptional regulator
VSVPEPKLQRKRTSDAVVDYILDELFSGKLREGDRVDLDLLAETLGVSRVPVREALAQLERDGVVRMPHHRGAFIAAFDARTIREAFELYGMLNGLTSSRVATRRDREVIEVLDALEKRIERTRDVDEFELLAREVRRVVNLAGGGPHLRALLKIFRGLVPAAARLGMRDAMPQERQYISAELEAIRRGSAATAAKTVIEHIRYSGECAIAGLVRRGVFEDVHTEEVPEPSTELLRVIRATLGGA